MSRDSVEALATLVAVSVLVVARITLLGDAYARFRSKLKGTTGTTADTSPSVARPLSENETGDLIELALALPADWCVQILPPYGQVSIGPLHGRRRVHRGWLVSGSYRRVVHDSGKLP